MSEAPQRFENIRRSSMLAGALGVSGVAGLIITASYLVLGDTVDGRYLMILVGIGVASMGLFMGAVYLFLRGLTDLALKIEATSFRVYNTLRDIHDTVPTGMQHLGVIADNVQLSDAVRGLMHRDRERTALRLAINEEIIRGDIEAAYALVEQLEERHGYKNEAARLRQEVDRSRQQLNSQQVHEAAEQVQAHLEAQEWDPARRLMDRLLAQHPNNGEVAALPKLFQFRRGEQKRRLLKEWDDAVRRNDVDRGIAILRELDQYLTRNEAAALEESARGVFRTKFHNLGLQFSFAVTEHNWAEALDVGKQIVDEFPNSRMAQEVRDRMVVLAKRADGEDDGESDQIPISQRAGSPASDI